MQRQNSTNWNIAEPITAARLNDFNEDLGVLFKELSNEDLSFTYNIQWQLTQLVDNENSITLNISWVDWEAETPKLYITRVWDTKRWTITYNTAWFIASVVYALIP